MSLSSEGGIAPLGKMSSAPKQTAVQKEKGEKRTAKKKESRVKRHAMAGLQINELSEKAHVEAPKVHSKEDLSSVYSSFKMREISEKNPIPNDKEGGEKHSAELDQKAIQTAKTHNMISKAEKDYTGNNDLGEGVGQPAADNEAKEKKDADNKKLHAFLEKAQEKTQKGIDVVTGTSSAAMAAQKKQMKETIEKATLKREEDDKKAQDYKNQAPNKWKEEHAKAAALRKAKWDAQREKGNKFVRELESKAVTKKEKKTAYWGEKIAEARNTVTRIREKEKTWYLKQVATWDEKRSEIITTAKQKYEEEAEKLETLRIKAQDSMQANTVLLKQKYETMIQNAEKEKHHAYKKLKAVETEAVQAAKDKIAQATATMQKQIADYKDQEQNEITASREMMQEADQEKETVAAEKDLLRKFELEYKTQLDKLKMMHEQHIHKVETQTRTELGEIHKSVMETHSEAHQRVVDAVNKAQEKHEKDQAHAIRWIHRAQTNSHSNCQDARESASMKAKAAKFAAHRIARDAQEQKVITKNHWRDAQERARELRKKKDREAQELKQTTVETAVKMAKNMYAPKDEELGEVKAKAEGDPPCEESFSMDPSASKIPDEGKLDEASADFAKAYIPIDQEDDVITKRDELRQKAAKVAGQKTWTWAHNHALKVAKQATKEAEEQCQESNKYFEDVESTASSQNKDEANEKVALKQQAQENATAWKNSQLQSLETAKMNITTTSATEVQRLTQEEKDKKKAIDEDSQSQIESTKQKIRTATEKEQSLKSKADVKLKISQETTSSKISEAQKLKDIAESEGETMERNAAARVKQETMTIDASTAENMDKYKREMHASIDELKNSADRAGGVKEVDRQLEGAKEEEMSLKEAADADYHREVKVSKGKQASIIEETVSKSKTTISKFKMQLEEQITGADEFVQKAIVKEKQKQMQIGVAKKEENEKSKKSFADFNMASEEKYNKMKEEARKRQREDTKAAEKKFDEDVSKDMEMQKKKIDEVRKDVVDKTEPPVDR